VKSGRRELKPGTYASLTPPAPFSLQFSSAQRHLRHFLAELPPARTLNYRRPFSLKSIHGQSISAFQGVEKIEQVDEEIGKTVNEEISEKSSEQVEQVDHTAEPARGPVPRSRIGARNDPTHARPRSQWQ